MTRSIKQILVPAALLGAVAFSTLAAQTPGHKPKYTRDLPAALLKQASVTEDSAAKIAQAKMPKARIQAVELENENGNLIYSYELKIAGHKGIEEVNVNAKTGAVVNTEHENGEAQKFYATLPSPARVGMEATCDAQWFAKVLREHHHELWIGDAAEIRAAMVRKQKTDSRDALHILDSRLVR